MAGPINYLMLVVGITNCILGLIIAYFSYFRKERHLMQVFFALTTLLFAFSQLFMAIGGFTNPEIILLTTKISFFFTILSLLALFLVSQIILKGTLSLKEVDIPKILIVAAMTVTLATLAFTDSVQLISWDPSPDTKQGSLFNISFIAFYALTGGLIIYSFLKLYLMVRDPKVKNHLQKFIGGFFVASLSVVTLVLASVLENRLFDALTPVLIMIGFAVMYFGLNLKTE